MRAKYRLIFGPSHQKIAGQNGVFSARLKQANIRLAAPLLFAATLLTGILLGPAPDARAAEVVKIFSFDTQNNWADGGNSGWIDFTWVNDTEKHVSFTHTKKNNTSTEYGRRSVTNDETWQTWGVPDGAVVTNVQIKWDGGSTPAYKEKTESYNQIDGHSIKMRIIDSSGNCVHGTVNDVLIDHDGTILGTSADTGGYNNVNQTGTQRAVGASWQDEDTYVRLELEYMGDTKNNSSFALEQRFDEIRLVITYGTPPSITARETVDSDGNGKIDQIKITADQNLDDDFSGLTMTVAGYTVTGYSSGTANDAVFYVDLTEGGSADTDATPTVTVTANTTLSENGTSYDIATDSGVAASDKAAPVIVSATGTLGSKTLTVTFSEAVDTSNSGAGDLVTGDFSYTDTSGDGAASISAMGADADGTDSEVTLTVNAAFKNTDSGSDTLAAAASQIYDLADNAAGTTAVTVSLCGYAYRRSIVIDHTLVGMDNSGTLPATGFPVLISLTGLTWLKTDPTGDIQDAQGDDIIFKDSDGSALYHEIEAYDGTNGNLTAWVRVDSLSKAVDTTIYMYYGNTCVTTATEDPDNVWDADFKGVWHLDENVADEGNGGNHDDSSGTNDGTHYGNARIAGKISYGQDFDGDNDYVDIDHADIKNSLSTANAATVSAWVKHDNLTTTVERQVAFGDQVVIRHDGGSAQNQFHFYIRTNDTLRHLRIYNALSTGVWSHVVGTWDGTTQKAYLDGYERDRQDPGSTLTTPTGGLISHGTTNITMDGIIDEVRVSQTARSDDWIRTEFNNQSDTTIGSGYFIKSLGSEDSDFFTLTDHAAGQETDAFTGDSSVTGAELFAFQLSNDSDAEITVSQIVFQLSASGIVETDFTESELKIYEDTNSDGTISGESTTVGGTGDVNAGVTTITFDDSTFSIPANTTVNYILKGNVSSLAVNNTLTIDLAPGNVSLTPSGTTFGFAATSATHTADDPLTFADHAAGQQTNAFFGLSPVTGTQLFGFQLTNNATASLTVDQVVFQLSAVSGVVEADFTESELKIYEDTNGDGTIAAGETTTVGGTGDVNAGVTTITFGINFSISAGATVNYILKGDVSNLVSNDTLTIDLAPGNVTLTPVAAVGGSAAASLTHSYCGKFQYAHRRTIVINNGKVGADSSGALPATGFPVLVSLSGNWLKATSVDAANGRIEHDDGYDIVFRESDGINQLDHEIEEYDGTNGKLVAWVRIDSLSKSADTTFHMDYGNACAAVDPSDPDSVWDANFKGVWHLNNGDSTAADFYRDSTANNEHGTLTDVSGGSSHAATEKIGGAYDFEGDDDYIEIDNFSRHFSDQMTLSGWVKPPTAHGDYDGYFGIRPPDVGHTQFYALQLQNSTDLEFRFRNSASVGYGFSTPAAVTAGTWAYITLTYDGDTFYGYVNTIEKGSKTDARGYFIRPGFSFKIGADGHGNVLDGIVDEVRFSDTVRDSDWIATEYNNQDDLDAQGVSNFGAGNFFKSLSDETNLCDFAYRRSIVIDYNNVGTDNSGTLPATGFPVLVSLTGDWLKTTTVDAVNGRIASDAGHDIVFRESDGKNGLYHEIEDYDGTAGTLVAWVRVDSLSKSANTTLYMYYGNFCIDAATEDPGSVWDTNFTGVWHLADSVTDEQTSGTHEDSTANSNGSQNGNDDAPGQIANGQDFDGDYPTGQDYINAGTSPGSATDLTVSYWMNSDVDNTYMRTIGKIPTDDAGDQGWTFMVRKSGDTGYDRALIFRIGDFTNYGGWGNEITAEQLYEAGQWVYVVGTFDYNGSNGGTGKLYVDGSQVASKSNTDNRGVANTATPLYIGWDYHNSQNGGGERFIGLIDEVRISKTDRTADWIKTSFNNQIWPDKATSDPNGGDPPSSGFFTLGAEDTSFTTAIELLSFTATGQNDTVQVAWETASETGNLGFYLYRADSAAGPYVRITDQLIPGFSLSTEDRQYAYADTDVTTGQPYYYKLEDLDIHGQRSFHSPVGVDWGGAGAPLVSAGDPDPAPWEPGGEFGPVTVSDTDEPVYKIMVGSEGIHRLTRDFLSGQGVALDKVDLSRVRLYHEAREVAIWVHDDNGDTVFDAADHITFYALPVADEFAKYSADNVYWLTTGAGSNPVKRMAAVDSTPDASALAAGFEATVRSEQDQYYYPASPGADELDRWLNSTWVVGAGISWPGAGDPITFTIDTPGPSAAAP